MGILVNTGFDVGSSNPIDSRTVKNTTDERDALISEGLVYENLKVYCKDTQTEYRWTGTEWEEVGTGGTVDLSGYAKTYTSLAELELTSSATINEVISKLSPGDVFTCSVTSFSSYQTMFPYLDSYDSDAFVFIHRGRTPVMSYAKWYRRDGSSEALAQFNALTGYIGGWTTFTTKKTYTTLTQLKLTADATITQVVNSMLEGESFRSIVTKFNNYQTLFPYEEEEDQNAYVLINKLNGNAVYVAWYRIDGTKHYIGHYTNNTLQNWVNYSPTSDLSEGATTYTSLTELGLTAPVSVGEVFNAMPNNTMAVLACEAKDETEGTVNISDIPMSFGVLTIKKNETGRFSIDYQNSLSSSPCNVKRWIGTLKGLDGTGLYWKLVSTQTTYTSLADLGLTTDATINDIIGAMKDNTTFTYKTDVFDYATEYNNIQLGIVTINKQSATRIQALMTDKNTGNLYVGRMDTNNLFVGWRNCSFHRVVTQATAGYFKFKPTSDGGFEQPLRISVTDNYGGMIEISGNAPSQTQYKPFKCVRLSHGTYTDYNASNPANNKMEKLFFLDGYMYLKIATYTTVTITGLIGVPTFVETIDDDAEEIPIVSAITTQYDGYGDPYIITIGDSVSGDGSIQTLASLGLPTDIMKWENGIYKVSHVSGLTGLPSDITNTSPGFRLEHHNIKKWNSNHNPSSQTWGQRHSIIYCDNGNIYHRFYESGATAGTYITDTGWQRVLLNGDIIDNLTSTDTNKLLSANQGKILNDTKLNKTDANKLNCVVIDNVSLKEYILTNFTETEEKTYYLIAKTTCTDLPKASNFYITVETPGLYTYKVTAKELNDSNGKYVCTYRTISSSWTKWEKVCTTTVADVDKVTITTQNLTEGIVSYFVKNGICYVSISGITPSLNGGSTIITANTLPLPNTKGNNHYTIGTTSGTAGLFVINNDGSATFYGQNTLSYFGQISYPVAE